MPSDLGRSGRTTSFSAHNVPYEGRLCTEHMRTCQLGSIDCAMPRQPRPSRQGLAESVRGYPSERERSRTVTTRSRPPPSHSPRELSMPRRVARTHRRIGRIRCSRLSTCIREESPKSPVNRRLFERRQLGEQPPDSDGGAEQAQDRLRTRRGRARQVRWRTRHVKQADRGSERSSSGPAPGEHEDGRPEPGRPSHPDTCCNAERL